MSSCFYFGDLSHFILSWVVATCSSEISESFGVIYHLHFQGRIIRKLRSQSAQLYACFSWFLAFLNLCPEDGGDIFLRNASLSPSYSSENRTLHSGMRSSAPVVQSIFSVHNFRNNLNFHKWSSTISTELQTSWPSVSNSWVYLLWTILWKYFRSNWNSYSFGVRYYMWYI
jgi:hypothetical protein